MKANKLLSTDGLVSWFILILLCVGCNDRDEVWTKVPPNQKDSGTSHLKVKLDFKGHSETRIKAQTVVKDGILLLVEVNPFTKKRIVVDRISFNTSQIDTSDYLKLETNVDPGKYILMVVVNPTSDMKNTVLQADDPWDYTIALNSESLEYLSNYLDVYTNENINNEALGGTSSWSFINIDHQTEDKPAYVQLNLTRIISSIQMKDEPLKLASNFEHKDPIHKLIIVGYVLINIPNQFYLWQRWDELDAATDSWLPKSPHKGIYKPENYIVDLNEYVKIKDGQLNGLQEWTTRRDFSKRKQYIPENYPTINEQGEVIARQWCTTAIIIRVRMFPGTGFCSYYRPSDNMNVLTVNFILNDKKERYVHYKTQGMFFTYFIKDPKLKAVIDGKKQGYPSINRNTQYVINFKELNRLGGTLPGGDLIDAVNKNKNIFDNFCNTRNTDDLPSEFVLELEVEE